LSRLEKSRRGWGGVGSVGGVGGVGGKSAFIHAAWDTPRPYLPHTDHTDHTDHPLPKYSLATKNEQCLLGGVGGG